MASELGRSRAAWWVLLALSAASVEPIVVKLGYRQGIAPMQLLALRNIFGAAVMLLVSRQLYWIGWRNLRRIAPLALLLLCTNGLVLFALGSLSAVTVITVMTTTPAFVAIVNQLRGRDLLGPRFWLGFACCFLGVALTVKAPQLGSTDLFSLGFLLLIGAVASSTTYRTRMELLTGEIPPLVISTYLFVINGLIATLVLLPTTLPVRVEALPVAAWLGAAAAAANLAFLAAMRLVGATRMSIFDLLQRPLVVVLAAVLLAEPLNWWQGLGIALVLGGVVLAKVKRQPNAHSIRTSPAPS